MISGMKSIKALKDIIFESNQKTQDFGVITGRQFNEITEGFKIMQGMNEEMKNKLNKFEGDYFGE